jgi:hypothetical protein
MAARSLFAAVASACVIWNVITSLRIYDDLRRRKIRVSFLWLRLLAPKYAHQYKRITTQENGRPGPLFYHWIISINLALVFAVVAVLS